MKLSAIALAVGLVLPLGSGALLHAQDAERTPASASALAGAAEKAVEENAYQVGLQAYTWGWPAVSLHNRRLAMRQAPRAGLVGGILPVAPINHLSMLTDYLDAGQRYVLSPNQDVVYGQTFLDLSQGPVIVQVPDFGSRYWVLHCMDAYTDVFAAPSSRIHSKPGFYLIVGPGWKGEKPADVVEVLRSPSNLAWVVPRVFMDDTAADRQAVQPLLNQMNAYPLSQFDGKAKPVDWRAMPKFPAPKAQGKGEIRWVKDETFWADLAAVLAENQPRAGEEALADSFKRVLAQAKADPAAQRGLDRALVEGAKLLDAGFAYSIQPDAFGNHWAANLKAGAFGTDYLRRAWVAKAYIATNKPDDALYIGTDYDGQGVRLEGRQRYSLTFPAGQLPPARDFWSLSAYDAEHFFEPNLRNRFSLGTKNKGLKINPDGSLTLYLQPDSPGADKETNWLPTPKGDFSLLLRLYGPGKEVVAGDYRMPAVQKL